MEAHWQMRAVVCLTFALALAMGQEKTSIETNDETAKEDLNTGASSRLFGFGLDNTLYNKFGGHFGSGGGSGFVPLGPGGSWGGGFDSTGGGYGGYGLNTGYGLNSGYGGYSTSGYGGYGNTGYGGRYGNYVTPGTSYGSSGFGIKKLRK